jgi:hypothetical protein
MLTLMNKKQFIPIAIAAFAACSLALAEGEKQVFRFGGIFAGPTGSVEEQGQFSEPVGDGTIFSFDGTARTDTDSTFGIAVDYEYRWSELPGLSVSACSARHDVEIHLGGISGLPTSSPECLFPAARSTKRRWSGTSP